MGTAIICRATKLRSGRFIFQALFAAHLKTFPAHLASFSAAAVFAYTLLARRVSFASSPLDAAPRPAILGRAMVVVLLALLLRCASLIQLVESWTWPPQIGRASCRERV